MSIEQSDSDHTLPLTPTSCFGPPDLVTIDMALSTGHPVVTSQVPTQVMTHTSVAATNPFVMATNIHQVNGGHPTHYEWVWFQFEGQSGSSLSPTQMECWSITLMVHQELGVMPLRIQQLSHWNMLIKFDSKVDVEWVAQKLLQMLWWMEAPCHQEGIPCCGDKGL